LSSAGQTCPAHPLNLSAVIVSVAVLLLLSGGKIVASPSALLAMIRAVPSSFLTTMEVVTSVAAFVPQAGFSFLPLVALTF